MMLPPLDLAENEDDDITIPPKLILRSRLRRTHDMSSTSCTEFVPVLALIRPPNVSVGEGVNKDVQHETTRKVVRPMFRRVTQDSPTFEIDIPKDLQHKSPSTKDRK